ncbi:hypothetical protein [Janthinobacterium fluminis]|uniref:Uncharacterized protein n=1 Tax=Janthinobacterium fluminis TaxID=2987524 RepID=A0ABT5JXV7_9BURK|nr:hypothetical protein [Janthinobacterium fluminis]MDC8757567.1 hypothetical protein [Janthinobacterium fluminis]
MNEKEEGVMAMYRESRPQDYVGEADTTNYLPWSLLTIVLGLIAWLIISLSNAENQRNALMTKACQDIVFPAELDKHCLSLVRTRDHWWEHVYYGLTHLRP